MSHKTLCGNNFISLLKINILQTKKNLLPALALLFLGFVGCTKENLSSPSTVAGLQAAGALKPIIKNAQAPVALGLAGNYVVLSKSGITNVYKSAISGDVGSSPITGAAILVSCAEVTGKIYSVDAAGPAPCAVIDPSRLTTSISDMETAYTDAAGRVNPDFLNLGAGDIGGKTDSATLRRARCAVSRWRHPAGCASRRPSELLAQ